MGYVKELKDFAENEKEMYIYDMGNCNGGQWIEIKEYHHKASCRWQYSTARGISNGIEVFLKRYKSTMAHKEDLIDAIEKGVEGFKVIPDEIGADAPLLMYNENDMDGKGLTFEEKWKKMEKMSEYLESRFS